MFKRRNRRIRVVVLAVLTLALCALVLVTVQGAAANVRLEDAGQVPFYARFAHDEVLTDGQWAAIAFYRPPDCVPDGFNLMNFFDDNAFGCQPPTTDGFQIWKNGLGLDEAPLLTVLHGLGAVPVWFVTWPELEGEMADGSVTIGDLEAMSSRFAGSADSFHETLKPAGGGKNSMLALIMSGTLDDGRSFWLQAQGNSASGHFKVQITIDE